MLLGFIVKYKAVLTQASWYWITALLMRSISIACTPFVLHFLSPEEFGVASLLSSFMNIGAVAVGFGLKQYCMIEYVHQQEKSTFIAHIIATYLLGAVPLLLFVGYHYETLNAWLFYNLISKISIIGMLFIIFCSFFVDLINVVFQFEQAVSLITYSHMAGAILLSSSKLLLLSHHWGPTALVGAQWLSITPVLFIGTSLLKKSFGQLFSINVTHIKTIIPKSLSCLPGAILPWILSSADRWCLAWWSTAHDVGIYAVADLCAQLLNFIIFYVWHGAYIPYLFNRYKQMSHDISAVEAEHMRLMIYLLVSGLLIITGGMYGGQYIIYLIFPKSYHSALLYIWLLSITQLVLLGISCVSCLLQYCNKTTFIAAVNIGTAMTNIVGNAMFIPRYGINGCVCTTLCAYLGALLCLTWRHHTLLKRVAPTAPE